MEQGVIFGLIKQQLQALVRNAVIFAGGFAVAKGLFTKDQWAALAPYLEAGLGSLAAAGMVAWSTHSNQAKVIIKTADELKQNGSGPTYTDEGGSPVSGPFGAKNVNR